MPTESPFTNRSLNLLKTLNNVFTLGNMDKRPNSIVLNEECLTNKYHVKWLIEKSTLIKKEYGEYVECSAIKKSSVICKVMLYPNGKKNDSYNINTYDPVHASLHIQLNNLRENTFIEGDVYILGKYGNTLLYKSFYGLANNLKHINFYDFFLRSALSSYLVDNALNIQFRIKSRTQTYKCVSDKSDYQVHNLPEMENFRRSACNAEEYSDVQLQVCNRMIKCHKYILASESRALLILFRSCERSIFDMQDKSTAVIEELIRFIYTGNIQSIKFNDICQVYIVADEFGVSDLKNICSVILKSNLLTKNVPYIFELAVVYKDQYLIEACIDFVKKNDIKSLKEYFIERSRSIKN